MQPLLHPGRFLMGFFLFLFDTYLELSSIMSLGLRMVRLVEYQLPL